MIAALIALGGTLFVLLFNIFDRSRSAFDDRMVKATELLTGGSQNRSVGIAIMEGAQRRLTGSRFRDDAWHQAAVGLLTNQAVYLLESSRVGGRPDEIRNLGRIVELLVALVKDSARASSKDIKAVAESLRRSRNDPAGRKKKWCDSDDKKRAAVGLLLSSAEMDDIEKKLERRDRT